MPVAEFNQKVFKMTHFLGDKIKGAGTAMVEAKMETFVKTQVHEMIEWIKENPFSMRQLGFMTGFLLAMDGFIGGIFHLFGMDWLKVPIDLCCWLTGMFAMLIEYKDPHLPAKYKKFLKEQVLFVYRPYGRPLVYLFWGVLIFTAGESKTWLGYEAVVVGLFITLGALLSIYHTMLGVYDGDKMRDMHITHKAMKDAFNKADSSGDGNLDSHEFVKFLHNIDIHLTVDDLETVLLEVDSSHDEQVSFEEFLIWYDRHDESQHV